MDCIGWMYDGIVMVICVLIGQKKTIGKDKREDILQKLVLLNKLLSNLIIILTHCGRIMRVLFQSLWPITSILVFAFLAFRVTESAFFEIISSIWN